MENEITITKFIRDEGTLVVFQGTDEHGYTVNFVAEHRFAQDIYNALVAGEESPIAVVPDYMILSRTSMPDETP